MHFFIMSYMDQVSHLGAHQLLLILSPPSHDSLSHFTGWKHWLSCTCAENIFGGVCTFFTCRVGVCLFVCLELVS